MRGRMKCLYRKFCLFFMSCFFAVFLSAFISGCGSNTNQAKGISKPIVTAWHWMSDRESAFLELAKRYEAETGVKINFELYAPSDAYAQKVRAAAQTNTLPDIFGILGGKRDFASFVNSGYIYDLT